MQELLNKTIKAIYITDGEHELIFETDQGNMGYIAWGDCCSETWFADINGVENLIGHKVLEVEEVRMDSIEDGRSRQEADDFYGVKIKTDKGYAEIIYRNSSNGYYGGSIDFFGDAKLSGKKITEDFKA